MGGADKWIEQVVGQLGWVPRRPELFLEALTHSSFSNEAQPDQPCRNNERLEFLGDAVLELVASDWLLSARPELSEGELSRLRAALVNEKALAAAAREVGLGQLLRLGRGEEISGGRQKDSLLADALEAVCGALYLDGGLEACREFILRAIIAPAHPPATQQVPQDAKSELQQLMQKRGAGLPVYRVVGVEGPDHRRRFEVEVSCAGGKIVARGDGASKKAAEQAAAQAALEKLKE